MKLEKSTSNKNLIKLDGFKSFGECDEILNESCVEYKLDR